MTEERSMPMRQRMIEDMRVRGMGEKAQQAHIRAIKDLAAFLVHHQGTQGKPSGDRRPLGTIMWMWGWWASSEFPMCSNAVCRPLCRGI